MTLKFWLKGFTSPFSVILMVPYPVAPWQLLQAPTRMDRFSRSYDPDHEMRQLNNEVNKRISGFADRDRVYYMDINEVFLDEEGQLPEEIMPDYLHPNEQGYRLWAEAMEPMMRQLLQGVGQMR